LVLAGMLAIYAFAAQQTRALEQLLGDSVRESEQRKQQLVALSRQYSDQGTSKKLGEDIARVEQQLRRRGELAQEMKTSVGRNVRGFSPVLSALARQTMHGVWLTGIEIGDKSSDLVIRGRALNAELIPAYVRSLRREEAFAGRSLSSLQVTAKEEAPRAAAGPVGTAPQLPQRYIEFTLNIPLGQAAPAGPDERAVS
jgi:hypothetical protein